MESEAAPDTPRQIKAVRICGSAAILLCGAFCLKSAWSLSKFRSLFISMVESGMAAMPASAKFFVKNQLPLMGAIVLTAMVLVWTVWTARRISSLIYLITFGVLLFMLLTEFINWAMYQPLITVITKFQG
jgi:hypothetical protein